MRLRNRTTPRGLAFEAFGVQAQVTFDDAALEQPLLGLLPPGWRPCAPSEETGRFGVYETAPGSYEITLDGITLMDQASLDVALEMLDAQIRVYVASRAAAWTFVHAGVVALCDGALLLPGESFSGKTTLVKALVERGAVYYSDEYAVLDRHGNVHPYSRPLRLRGATAVQSQDVAELGGVAGNRKADVRLVAVTRYRIGGEWHPTVLPAGRGATLLLAHAAPAQLRPQQSLQALTRAVRGATVLEGDRGEAGPAAAALLQTLRALT